MTARSGEAVTRNGRNRRAAQRTDAHSASSIRPADGPAPVTFTIGLSAIGFRRSASTTVGDLVGQLDDPAADATTVEVDTNDRADLHGRREVIGNEVVELLVEPRDVGEDPGDQRRSIAFGAQFRRRRRA